ncbi:MAG TPA: thermonuclease family protein [Clostridiales bacterium]|nr:thermonuclease family protein [Clostridiales bacterium]
MLNNSRKSNRFYNHTWFIWFALIFITPVGVFLMWKNQKYSRMFRISITTIFIIWFSVFVAAAYSNSDEYSGKDESNNRNTINSVIVDGESKDETGQSSNDKSLKTDDLSQNNQAAHQPDLPIDQKTDHTEINEKREVNGKDEVNESILLDKARVKRVVDGDTIEVDFGDGKTEKVRLIGVNCPESTIRQDPYGKEASEYTKKMLTDKTVYLEKDVSDRDKYGRLLRIVWITEPEEISETEIRDKMYNAELVLGGYAQVSTYPPDVKYADYFKKFTSEAREANKGLWALKESKKSDTDTDIYTDTDTDKDKTAEPEQNNKVQTSSLDIRKIKGNINSKGEKIYHVPGGMYYDKTIPEEWFETEEEAKAAGYRKSMR